MTAQWIKVENYQFKPEELLYIVCESEKHGGGTIRLQTMAKYVPYMTVKEEDFMDDQFLGEGDYNEEEDEFYTKEGFYEYQTQSDTHWRITEKVTHVMPLFKLPE